MKSPRMNALSTMLAALALALGSAAPVLAQDPADAPSASSGEHGRGHGHGRHGHHGRGHGPGRFSPEAMEHRLERLTVELSLDEHQVTLVREIFAAARTEAQALRALPRGDARRDAGRALFESVAERIDAVLTDTQREAFARLRAEHSERREARRERREERRTARRAPEGI